MNDEKIHKTKTGTVAQPIVKEKLPSVFKLSAWIVDNEIMHGLESGKIHTYNQHTRAVLTFTEEPKKWGTLLSKIVGAMKDEGEIYFPPRMTDGFLIISQMPKRGHNDEGFWYVTVRR